MRLPFCDHHICACIQSLSKGKKPLDLALSEYLKAHKSIGAHDRRMIGETLYGMARWKSLIDYFCPSPHPLDRLACFRSLSPENCQQDLSIPEQVRLGVNDFLYERLIHTFGLEETRTLCKILNGAAPTTIRTNLQKTTRESLFQIFSKSEDISLCEHAPAGIQFKKRVPLFSLPEFKEGLFEVQDEGSQLVSDLIQAKPGDHVFDYCSGSGGKTLAFAPRMNGKGQIYLHDIRPWMLVEAKKRLKRAGIQNAQCFPSDSPHLSKLKSRMDWLLADVPCSGTGTLRRNPDAKWKIDAPMVERLVQEQRAIVKASLPFLKKGGFFVYATCSLLPEENEEQTAFFLAEHPLELQGKPLSLLPKEGGMDGFYSALFRKI